MSRTLLEIARQIQRQALNQDHGNAKQINRLHTRSRQQASSLEEEFRIKISQILSELSGYGWKPVVYWGVRTPEQQAVLHEKGVGAKTSLHVHGAQKVVHRAGWDYVQTGQAADIIDARYLWNGLAADKAFRFWVQLGEAAEKRGLEWGGRWTNRDVAHVQWAHYQMKPLKGKRDDAPYLAGKQETLRA